MAGFSDYLELEVLDHIFGGGDFTRPATIYADVHLATTLDAGAASGQNQIVTVHDVPQGATIVIDPLNLAEAKTVASKTGSGPYTLTLNSNLSNAYNAGTHVKYDPLDVQTLWRAPSGGSYARKSITNDATNFPAASGGQKLNGASIDFVTATADWGLATHVRFMDASSGGNPLAYGPLTVPKLILNGDTLTFAANQIVISLD